MKRLTESRSTGGGYLKACEYCEAGLEFDCCDCAAFEEAIDRLAELEEEFEKQEAER